MSVQKYLVADYYDNFRCKCGACRSCCCEGWAVTVSYVEYMRLLGLTCSKGLRSKLDRAFFILPDADENRYAELNRTYTGDCPLRDSDGMCALQKSLGEKVLPSVCKMYPRNFKVGGIREGACALSCEAVLELMFSTTEKLSFRTEEIDADTPAGNELPLPNDFAAIQTNAIAILQKRDLSLSERLIKLGLFINKISEEPVEKAKSELDIAPDEIVPSDEYPALDVSLRLAEYLNGYSESFSKYGVPALNNLGYDSAKTAISAAEKTYRTARAHLYAVLPDFDVYMEDILVNHLFFKRFPHSPSGETYLDEYAAFTGVYALVKLIATGYMVDKGTLADFVDCTAGIFRYLEHGNADALIKAALATFSFDALPDLAALAKL